MTRGNPALCTLARIASENLSRVDCSFCGGRLYTHHKLGCPVPAAQERRNAALLKTMTEALRDTR